MCWLRPQAQGNFKTENQPSLGNFGINSSLREKGGSNLPTYQSFPVSTFKTRNKIRSLDLNEDSLIRRDDQIQSTIIYPVEKTDIEKTTGQNERRTQRLTWGIYTRREGKLYIVRSRLAGWLVNRTRVYRSQFLQANIRWKALAET